MSGDMVMPTDRAFTYPGVAFRRTHYNQQNSPEQADDVADAEVTLHERGHGDARICWLLPPVIADAAHYMRRHPHLQGLIKFCRL